MIQNRYISIKLLLEVIAPFSGSDAPYSRFSKFMLILSDPKRNRRYPLMIERLFVFVQSIKVDWVNKQRQEATFGG